MTRPSPGELTVREALFRAAMSLDPHMKSGTWFVDFGGDEPEDPPDGFLARFADMTRPVRKVSESRRDELGCVRDRETGEEGWVVKGRVVRWLGERTAEVEYSRRHGLEAGGGGSGRAVLNAGGDRCVLQIDEVWNT